MNNISKNQIEEISFQAGYIFNKIGIPDYKRDYMDDNYERIIRVFLHEDCSPDYEEWDYELERKIKIFWKKGYEKGNNLRKKLYEREQKKQKKFKKKYPTKIAGDLKYEFRPYMFLIRNFNAVCISGWVDDFNHEDLSVLTIEPFTSAKSDYVMV